MKLKKIPKINHCTSKQDPNQASERPLLVNYSNRCVSNKLLNEAFCASLLISSSVLVAEQQTPLRMELTQARSSGLMPNAIPNKA